jgi:hypothetical protein
MFLFDVAFQSFLHRHGVGGGKNVSNGEELAPQANTMSSLRD